VIAHRAVSLITESSGLATVLGKESGS
jgi:hypothetical protein